MVWARSVLLFGIHSACACELHYPDDQNSTTLMIRIPLPWWSEFHYPDDLKTLLRMFQAPINVNDKMIKHAILSHLYTEKSSRQSWILNNFLLGIGGFVFPNGDQKVPFQPYFRQNIRFIPGPRGSALHDPDDLPAPPSWNKLFAVWIKNCLVWIKKSYFQTFL